jgi:hypothetical protein
MFFYIILNITDITVIKEKILNVIDILDIKNKSNNNDIIILLLFIKSKGSLNIQEYKDIIINFRDEDIQEYEDTIINFRDVEIQYKQSVFDNSDIQSIVNTLLLNSEIVRSYQHIVPLDNQ